MNSTTLYSISLLCAGLLAAPLLRAETIITGIVDVFVERTSAPGRAAVILDSSGLGVSRLVVKSAEQVGPDTFVSAYLEGRIFVDTGKAAYDGGLFNRMSYVTLRHGGAKISLGKQYSPHLYQLASQFDIFETSFWATPYAIFQGANRYTIIPGAVSVTLDTALGRPLKLSALWADRKMEVGKGPAGKQLFLSALYNVTPKLNIGFSAVDDEHFSFAEPHARVLLAGANYDAGKFRLSGGIQTIDLLRSGDKLNEYCVGAGYFISPSNLVQVSHARTYQRGYAQRNTQVIGIALIHQLSRRTALYGSIGHLSNKAEYSNAFDLELKAGESSDNVMVGIKHDF